MARRRRLFQDHTKITMEAKSPKALARKRSRPFVSFASFVTFV
jgi:hypothetical protein